MLFLQMKYGDYLTIGEDIVIQVFPDSSARARVAVKAPRDMTVLRGDVWERNGEKRPDCLAGSVPAELQRVLSGAAKQPNRFPPADEPVEIQ